VSADKSTDRSGQLIAVTRKCELVPVLEIPAQHAGRLTADSNEAPGGPGAQVLTTSGFRPKNPIVLVFDLVPGLVAQWESVRLTRGRSLVRNQPGPLPDHSPLASAPPSPEHDSDGERSDE
jgi:hypothetical protein